MEEKYFEADRQFLEPKFENEINLINSKRAVEGGEKLLEVFCEKISTEDMFGLSVDGASGSAYLVRE